MSIFTTSGQLVVLMMIGYKRIQSSVQQIIALSSAKHFSDSRHGHNSTTGFWEKLMVVNRTGRNKGLNLRSSNASNNEGCCSKARSVLRVYIRFRHVGLGRFLSENIVGRDIICCGRYMSVRARHDSGRPESSERSHVVEYSSSSFRSSYCTYGPLAAPD